MSEYCIIFPPGNQAEVFTWQNFQPPYRDYGWKNRDRGNRAIPALSYEHIDDLEGRRDLGNRASQPGSYEEALMS